MHGNLWFTSLVFQTVIAILSHFCFYRDCKDCQASDSERSRCQRRWLRWIDTSSLGCRRWSRRWFWFLIHWKNYVKTYNNSLKSRKWYLLTSPGDQNTDELVSLLIQNGANLNAKSYNGETPLHRAALAGLFQNMKQAHVTFETYHIEYFCF